MLGFRQLSNAHESRILAFMQAVQLPVLNIPFFVPAFSVDPKSVSCTSQILLTCFRGDVCHVQNTCSVHIDKQIFSPSFIVILISI